MGGTVVDTGLGVIAFLAQTAITWVAWRATVQPITEHDRARQRRYEIVIGISFFVGLLVIIISGIRSSNISGQLEVLKNLQMEGINTTTGGDSFCYIGLALDDKAAASTAAITAVHVGKYPLTDVSARMVDVQISADMQAKHEQFGFGDRSTTNIYVGDLSSGATHLMRQPIPIVANNQEQHDFNIFFSAKNGFWTEIVRMRFINGRWSEGIQVLRQVQLAPGTRPPMYFEQKPDDFQPKCSSIIADNGECYWE